MKFGPQSFRCALRLSTIHRLVFGLALSAVCAAAAASGSVSPTLAGQSELATTIEKALDKADIKGVTVRIEAGAAILSGRVRNIFVKDEAIQIALEHAEAVESELEVSAAESDSKLGQALIKKIRGYSRLEVFDDVSVAIKDGRVTAFGWVTQPYKESEILDRMRDVLGIQEFDNKIKVLPLSQLDDRLRRNLANRIYRDPSFSDYASMPIPPVHIIVANSRVVLVGFVRSKLEKQKAMSIARQTQGVLSVEDRLRTQ